MRIRIDGGNRVPPRDHGQRNTVGAALDQLGPGGRPPLDLKWPALKILSDTTGPNGPAETPNFLAHYPR